MRNNQFEVKNIVNKTLSDLSERSQDVVVSRFGVGRDTHETLEAIGQRYGITRERVRQIEADALKHIRQSKVGSVLAPMLASLNDYIGLQGGVIDEPSLTTDFSKNYFSGTRDTGRYRGMVSLLLSVGDQFKKAPANDKFINRWYINKENLSAQETLCSKITGGFSRTKTVVDEDQIASMARTASNNIGKNVVLNYITGSKMIGQNVFGLWGLSHWAEIRPRGVKDKAYLVMKQEGKPLHFRDVATHINDNNFSSRTALAQTVHNELIKDNRFILVGRGLYALKEWGYKEGTVKDVITRVLKEKGPLSKDDLVQAVLTERFVIPSTVILNLNSLKKTAEGKDILA